MRGKPLYPEGFITTERITPAGAGKTRKHFAHNFQRQDHPRRCGENSFGLSNNFPQYGSPPQVRGKQQSLLKKVAGFRITPAGAGKTSKRNCSRRTRQDHPRRCGENPRLRGSAILAAGSPPQVRGKQTYMGYSFFNDRITPAGAGKTQLSTGLPCRKGDHPRRCGENKLSQTDSVWDIGSPPQVRGKLPFYFRPFRSYRITPAGAGKTSSGSFFCPRYWDHPRRCGENEKN